ncbi:alcohol dehydrogenase catalytic domain-containing protein [Dactylosporangium sp. NBC_01737]|uniref:zinc-dependent alcohol dehydrogenase n=1 Tax=Dactylosporangium sp. NBC_01737 TaxID=2975959 RepID=UPI002E13799C|nr:alcohol dehydrogenase catalytic domain-containing protein [Dactylosporangium sp. NBC_01737]
MVRPTALVLTDYGRLERQEFQDPDVGDDDALLRVEACGMCGSDHEVFTGRMRWPLGFIPGHETVGVIERIGPAASARWGVREGDRVAVSNRRACRTCDRCAAGDLANCVHFGPMTSYGMVPTSVPPSLWGGYATHHYLAPESVVHRVPAALDPVSATLFNPLAGAVTWAVEAPALREGEVVAILGPGIRGICAAAAAKAAGAAFVLVTGAGPHDAERLATARQVGADLTVDVTRDDPVEALRSAAGRLADVVVDITAHAPAAFGQAMELAALRARVVYAGSRGDGVTAVCRPDLITTRELRLTGVRGVSTSAPAEALRLLGEHRFPFEHIARTVAGFDTVPDLLLTMSGDTDRRPPLHAVFSPLEGLS